MKKIVSILFLFLFFSSCINDDLVSCIEVSSQEVKVNELITFTSCTDDADFYEWDFDDGEYSNDKNTTHSYTVSGEYIVNLYVENDFTSDVQSLTIKVNP